MSLPLSGLLSKRYKGKVSLHSLRWQLLSLATSTFLFVVFSLCVCVRVCVCMKNIFCLTSKKLIIIKICTYYEYMTFSLSHSCSQL